MRNVKENRIFAWKRSALIIMHPRPRRRSFNCAPGNLFGLFRPKHSSGVRLWPHLLGGLRLGFGLRGRRCVVFGVILPTSASPLRPTGAYFELHNKLGFGFECCVFFFEFGILTSQKNIGVYPCRIFRIVESLMQSRRWYSSVFETLTYPLKAGVECFDGWKYQRGHTFTSDVEIHQIYYYKIFRKMMVKKTSGKKISNIKHKTCRNHGGNGGYFESEK